MSRGRLAGRRALVTGGASGIGRASALRLAAEGASVAVVDVRAGAADPVAAEVTAADGNAISLTCDVRDEGSVETATRAAADAFDGLDTVVACAGITATGATHAVALADWQFVISVNLTGVFLVVEHAVAHLLDAGGGAIVTVGSTASLVAAGRTASYDASKGGVLQFTPPSPSSTSTKGSGPTVCAPALSVPAWPPTAENSTRRWRRVTASPGRRGGCGCRCPRATDPSEIAAVVAFLCSDEASFLTGAAIPVDGGYTAI